MKLYGDPISTTCRPVMLLAAESGMDLKVEHIDLFTGAHMKPEYATVNPSRQVPVLDDDGFTLSESSAILKYLADKIGSPAYPKDLKARAKVNEMMDWINTNFYREWGYNLCYPQIFPPYKRKSDEVQAGTLEWGKEQSKRWLRVLNGHWLGPDKKYLCGDQITIADYFAAGIVSLGDVIRVDFSAYPNVKRWLDTMKKLPSWPKVNEAFDGLVASVKSQPFVTIAK